jgi:hypothetical protein
MIGRREFITLLGGMAAAMARSVQPAQSSRWDSQTGQCSASGDAILSKRK